MLMTFFRHSFDIGFLNNNPLLFKNAAIIDPNNMVAINMKIIQNKH